MDQPLVCCILPFHTTKYVDQAIACFNRQTYGNRTLISVDTSKHLGTVGAIRNELAAMSPAGCLIAHWDHDDWSAPERIASQVEFMRAKDCGVVGYNDLPFYDVTTRQALMYQSGIIDGYGVGTSLLYRREVWERTPFRDIPEGEDESWINAVKREQGWIIRSQSSLQDGNPMLVARIHPGNTSKQKHGVQYKPAEADLANTVLALQL